MHRKSETAASRFDSQPCKWPDRPQILKCVFLQPLLVYLWNNLPYTSQLPVLAANIGLTVWNTHTCLLTDWRIGSRNTFDDFKTSGIFLLFGVVKPALTQPENWKEKTKIERQHLCPPQSASPDVQTAEKHSSWCYSRSQISKRAAEAWRRPNLNQPGLRGADHAAETGFMSWHPKGALMCTAVT